MKPCKMFYDMGIFGIEEFEFMSWDEAFEFWKEQKPPGPLVRKIYLVNLTYHTVFVSPPGHKGNAIWLHARLSYPMPGQSHDLKYYTGRNCMLIGYPITNQAFSYAAYNKAVEDKEWDEIYFRKTGKHWQGHERHEHQEQEEAKHEREENSGMTGKRFSLNRSDCLKLLGLKPGFTKKELETAYTKTVQKYHPDKVGPHVEALPKEFKDLAEFKTKQINFARDLLIKDFK